MAEQRLSPGQLVAEARKGVRPTSRWRWRGVTQRQLDEAASDVRDKYLDAATPADQEAEGRADFVFPALEVSDFQHMHEADMAEAHHESPSSGPAQASSFVPLLTHNEVAQMLRVDPKMVTRWAKAGKLTSIRTLGGHRRYLDTEVRALQAGLPQDRPE